MNIKLKKRFKLEFWKNFFSFKICSTGINIYRNASELIIKSLNFKIKSDIWEFYYIL